MINSSSTNATINGVRIPDDIYIYSNRKNYISYFYINKSEMLYVFDQDVVKLQSKYKSNIRVYINRNHTVYTKIARDKILLSGLIYNHKLVETAWGYEEWYEIK
jgi:hypothetical protein